MEYGWFKKEDSLFLSHLQQTRDMVNPLPVQFKAVLRGQKGCVFFSGHLNLPTTPEIGLPSKEKKS